MSASKNTPVRKAISGVAGKTGISTSEDFSDFFPDLFRKYPALFDTIIARAAERNIQIIYTRVDRRADNSPVFTDFSFNLDARRYFYPASTVKLPAAILALQKINELKSTGLTASTTMITGAGYSGQTAVYTDSGAAGGKPSISQYIRKIFLVSDNDAFNRIYEFLGQQYLNEELHKKGYPLAQLLHRLDIFLTEDENRHTNPVTFLADDSSMIYQQPLVYNRAMYQARNDFCGKAYYKGDTLINAPMNFSKKNRLTLSDLHQILRSLLFPAAVPVKQRFNLTLGDYAFLYKYLSEFPAESASPLYEKETYPNAYVKFFLDGAVGNESPQDIRIFNKSGEAYGQLTDISYVVDFKNKTEFFLSATISCVVDGVLNNDKYDYDTAGYPFLKNLCKVIYENELHRKRSHKPDLRPFRMRYD